MPIGRPLVQGELSLDGVKVVRNDLSESDLEIVEPKKKQAKRAESLDRVEKPRLENSLGRWGAPGEQVLGIGKT